MGSLRAAMVALVALLPSTALAAAPEDAAKADALFKEGLRLFDSGQTAKACAKFADSYQIDPALGTLQNLALCREKEGKLAEAFAELTDLLTKAQATGKKQRADVAHDHLAALEPKIGRVNLSFGDGVTVTAVEVDGAARDWHRPVVLDPGHHAIVARAEGRPDARAECDVAAGSTQSVSVAFTGGAPAVATPAPAPPTPAAPAPAPPPGAPPKAVFWAIAGVGAAGVVVGSVFGAMTFAQKSSGDSHCSGTYCDASGLSSQDSAHTSATISTVSFAVGLAAIAVDVVLLLTAPKVGSPPSKASAPGSLVVTF
jgi:hypothetical protein